MSTNILTFLIQNGQQCRQQWTSNMRLRTLSLHSSQHLQTALTSVDCFFLPFQRWHDGSSKTCLEASRLHKSGGRQTKQTHNERRQSEILWSKIVRWPFRSAMMALWMFCRRLLYSFLAKQQQAAQRDRQYRTITAGSLP